MPPPPHGPGLLPRVTLGVTHQPNGNAASHYSMLAVLFDGVYGHHSRITASCRVDYTPKQSVRKVEPVLYRQVDVWSTDRRHTIK